jgi:Protein tyrosine and serine/threonine kinase
MVSEASRRGWMPSHFIISKWSSRYGHNVTELFKLLSVMESFDAMESIKDLVDPAYHVWMKPKKLSNGSGKNIRESEIFKVEKKQVHEKEPKADKEALKELLSIPEICVQELEAATNNWHKDNKLGSGGFGVVYKGEYKSTEVAIKKLKYRGDGRGTSKEDLYQFLNELRLLNKVRHDNILPIYGYAFQEDGAHILVCQLMAGALDERLKRNEKFESLNWMERWTIAKGTAR